MKFASNAVLAAALSFSTATAFSAPDTLTYSFEGHAGSPMVFPGMDFGTEVEGKLTTRLSPMDGNYSPDLLHLQFENMPDISVRGFSRQDSNRYLATVKNAWIFRSVTVEVDSPSGFDMPHDMNVRVLVDYQDNYVGTDPAMGPSDGPVLVDVMAQHLQQKSTFSTIDVYRTTAEGKRVILKLNKNLSRRINEQNGVLEEGFELKITWFGHGERSYYIPHPFMSEAEPFAIISDAEFAPPGAPEHIAVRFNEGPGSNETYMMPLEQILMEAFDTPSYP